MKIIPTRTHRLGGRRVEFGKTVDVPEEDAALALRHGWATKAPARAEKTAKPDQTTGTGGDGVATTPEPGGVEV